MEQGKHISIQRMARLEMERSDRPDPSLEALTRHMAECDACRAVYEEVKRTIGRSPGPAHPPAFYPALDSEPCPRMESLENYQRLPLAERLSVWAHVVFGHCEDCAAMAHACGLVFDAHKDPVTQSLAERLGARAPRFETPVFFHAMAGAASEDAGLTETMNATVLMTVRPRKRSYRLTVYRKRPAEPGGFWQVRVQFEEDVRLPRGFSMFIYQDGSPDKPIRASYTGELELELPEGIYHLNLNNQDYLLIPLISKEPQKARNRLAGGRVKMLRKATRGKELTLELTRNAEIASVSWGGSFWSDVGQSSLRTALSEIRGGGTKTPLYTAGDNLANVLHIEGSISQIDRCGGLIHVHGDDPGTDFPMEMLVRNRHLPNAYLGARYPCSNKFASAEKDILMPAGTVQHVFLVDGTQNSAHPGGISQTLDVLKRSQIQPLIEALKPYKKHPFTSGQLREDGLYMVCDSADEENYHFGLGQLRSGAPGEMRNDMIIFAGHVIFRDDGEPMLVIGDQLLPVDCLFSLDRKPRLIILVGCGPEQDAYMREAARRLMCRQTPGSCAYGVISAAYPVRFDASVGLIQRLLQRMVRAQGREHLDELLRQAREETLRRVEDADRDILAFRYFGSYMYKPALLMDHTRWRSMALVCAALLTALSLALSIPAVRIAAVGLFRYPAQTNAPDVTPTGTPEAAPAAAPSEPAVAPMEPAVESAASPSFGDIVVNRDGTLHVTVHDCPESVALGVFLQVQGDASWYCKDAGMVREGEQFTVRWHSEGTNDDNVKKIALFLYQKSEVHTTTSYALVKARSIASKELTGLMQ